jgi:hypothetical protein
VSERDLIDFRREAATVAKKLHSVMSRIEFTEGTMVGTLAGILLYAISIGRAMGLSRDAMHALLEVLDRDFATAVVDEPKRSRDLSAAVKAADAEADRIIAKAQEEADKENHE